VYADSIAAEAKAFSAIVAPTSRIEEVYISDAYGKLLNPFLTLMFYRSYLHQYLNALCKMISNGMNNTMNITILMQASKHSCEEDTCYCFNFPDGQTGM